MTMGLVGIGPGGGAPYPVIMQRVEQGIGTDAFDNAKEIIMPARITAGSLLIAIISCTSTVSSFSGFTLVASDVTTLNRVYVYKKTAAGTEGGTTLTVNMAGNGAAAIHFYEIKAPQNEVTVAFGVGTDDPPNVTLPATDNYALIAASSSRRNDNNVVTTPDQLPAGYINPLYSETSGNNTSSTTSITMVSADGYKNAIGSENPAAFTWGGSLSTPMSVTIGIR